MNAPVFLQRKVNFYPRTQQKMLQHWFILVCKRKKIIRVKSQANKSPYVSAALGKLLPKKTRFQFPHCVLKIVLFPKVITIFKLIYLFWFKMEQTLDFALLASRQLPFRHVFSARFPGVVLLGWDDLFNPRRLSLKQGTGNGERGIFKMGNLQKRESLKWGIFKTGNL